MYSILELEMNFPDGYFAHDHKVKLVTFIMLGQVKSLPVLSSSTVINILKVRFYNFFQYFLSIMSAYL